MDDPLSELRSQIHALQADAYVSTASILALRAVFLDLLLPDDPAARAKFDAAWLVWQQRFLQQAMLSLEDTAPGLAAELTARLQNPKLSFPLSFDDP
jgi:hypothetical protein